MVDSVGAVYVRVIADTSGMKGDIERAAKDLDKGSNSSVLTKRMKLLAGTFTALGSDAAVALSGMSGGLLAVASSAGQAVGALSALVPIGVGLAGAFTGVAIGSADARDAMSTLSSEFQKSIKEGKKFSVKSKEIQKALKGLTPEARKFVLVFADLLPVFQKFKKEAEAKLFVGLADSFRTLSQTAIPSILRGLLALTVAANQVAKNLTTRFAGFDFSGMFAGLAPTVVTMGNAFGALGEAFFTFVRAATPAAQALSEWIRQGAESLLAMVQAGERTGALSATLLQWQVSLKAIAGLARSIAGSLFTLMQAGAPTGNQIIDALSDQLDELNKKMKSAEGQKALQTFFTASKEILKGFIPVLEALQFALITLVTPEAIVHFQQFMLEVARVIAALSQLLSIVEQSGAVNFIAGVFGALAGAIQPLVPMFEQLAAILQGVLVPVLDSMRPMLEQLAAEFGKVLDAVISVFDRLDQDVASGITGLLGVLTGLASAIIDAFAPILYAIIPAFVALTDAILPGLRTITDAFGAVADTVGVTLTGVFWTLGETVAEVFASIAPLVGSLITSLGPVIAQIGQGLAAVFSALGPALTDALGGIIFAISGILHAIGPIFSTLASSFAQVLPTIGTVVAELATIFGGLIRAIAPIFEQLASMLGPLFVGLFQELGPLLGVILSGIGGLARELLPMFGTLAAAIAPFLQTLMHAASVILPPLLKVFTQLAGIVGGLLIQAISTIVPALIPLVLMFAQFASEVLPQLMASLLPIVEILGQSLIAILAAILPVLGPIMDVFMTLISTILPPLILLIATLVQAIAPLIVQLVSALAPILIDLAPLFTQLGEVITLVFGTLISIVQTLTPILEILITVFIGIVTVVSQVVNVILSALIPAFRFVVDAMNDVWNFISALLIPIFNTAKDMISSWVSTWLGLFAEWKDKILGYLQAVWDWISGVWNGLVDLLKDPFEKFLDFVSGIPGKVKDKMAGVWDTLTPDINIPFFASGGIVNSPTLAMIGERGPEAVIPLNRPINMINPQVREMARMMRTSNPQTTNQRTVNVTQHITPAQSDPNAVAMSVLNRAAVLARG